MDILENKPRINAKLYESFIKNCCGSLHRTTVTSVDAVHTYASARAYVDASSRGATLDVWLCHTWVLRKPKSRFMNAD